MNRTAAIARDLAEFFIEKKVKNPQELTYEDYKKLEPPYTIRRIQVYFTSFARGMSHAKRHMEMLQTRIVEPTEVVVKRSVAPKKPATKKKESSE